jgi:hypothetical protein
MELYELSDSGASIMVIMQSNPSFVHHIMKSDIKAMGTYPDGRVKIEFSSRPPVYFFYTQITSPEPSNQSDLVEILGNWIKLCSCSDEAPLPG